MGRLAARIAMIAVLAVAGAVAAFATIAPSSELELLLERKSTVETLPIPAEALLPPPEVAEKLRISPSDPVLKSVKISHSTDRLFTEYNICYYVGSEYRYYVQY